MIQDPLYSIDFYKADHRSQYPDGTTEVFSNWTARSSRMHGVDHVVFFGLSYYLQEYLVRRWRDLFFRAERGEIERTYKTRMAAAGLDIDTTHIGELHELGYLPVEFYALPEGTHVPVRCPMFVMRNTHPKFFWLTNYLETQISSVLWGACTSATIAAQYRKIFEEAMNKAGGDLSTVDFQGHDFSYRGMYGTEAAALSGAGHLLSFKGTDSVPAISLLMDYYGADAAEVGGSIPATEHSVMCMGTKEDERETYRRLIEDIYPSGPVSIVSDTWDYWKVLTETIPSLKEKIIAREGTLVIRPDSGDPVEIICGDPNAPAGTPERLGTFEILWNHFGGLFTGNGYKQISSKVGAIYGDSITLERASEISRRLLDKGFVPSVVYGIGSYTYQHVTRDTFGFAMKATAGVVDGKVREIFKDPKTDDGTKKSLRGYVSVVRGEGNRLKACDRVEPSALDDCAFELVFRDGSVIRPPSLASIRERVRDFPHSRNCQ